MQNCPLTRVRHSRMFIFLSKKMPGTWQTWDVHHTVLYEKAGVIDNPKRARAENTLEQLRQRRFVTNGSFCDQPAMAERLGASSISVDLLADEAERYWHPGGDGTVPMRHTH